MYCVEFTMGFVALGVGWELSTIHPMHCKSSPCSHGNN